MLDGFYLASQRRGFLKLKSDNYPTFAFVPLMTTEKARVTSFATASSSSNGGEIICDGVVRVAQLIREVQEQMKTELDMSEKTIGNGRIFVSKDYREKKRVLIIIPYRQAGVWSHSICLNGDGEAGSMLGYLRKAVHEQYGIIIMNPAGRHGSDHVEQVWEQIVTPLLDADLFLVAHSHGSRFVQHLLNFDNGHGIIEDRLRAVALVEPSHAVSSSDTYFARRILAKRSIAWILSAQVVVGQKIPAVEKKYGCVCISAGPVPANVTGSSNAWALQHVMSSVFGSFAARSGRASGITQKTTTKSIHCGICRRKLRLLNRKIQCAWCEVRMCSHCTKEACHQGIGQMCLLCQSLPCLINPMSERQKSCVDRKSIFLQPKKNESLSLMDFELIKLIGKGACGRVKLVRKNHGHDEGTLYAMKTIRKKLVMQKGLVEATNAERRILNQVCHPFITQLCYAFQTDAKLYLLTKYYPGGSLLDQMRKVRRFTEDRARLYAAQVILALEYLHERRIMYRDLKLENVLCDLDGNVALTDFGMSKENTGCEGRAKTFVGTYQMMAPDILSGKPYTNAIDFWALGIMVYEMIDGRTPFNGKDNAMIKQKILQSEVPFSPRFSPVARDFVSKLLKKDPEERLGTPDIRPHPWFKDLDWDKVYRREETFTNQPILMKTYANAYTVDDIFDTYMQTTEIAIDTPASVKSSTEDLFGDFAYNYFETGSVTDE